MFAKDPRANGVRKDKLAEAMSRLVADNKIHVRSYGKPSRPYFEIVRGAAP
jgi:hypothetical protein